MLRKTRGIIIQCIRYSDSKQLAKIYTLNHGLQTFSLTLSRSKSSKIKPQHLQMLNQVELSYNEKPNREIQTLNELNLVLPYYELHTDVQKSSVSVFINEILQHTLKVSDSNTDLFDFLSVSLQWLDNTSSSVPDFHLYFLLELTHYLGFYPHTENNEFPVFDLRDGIFSKEIPLHADYLNGNDCEVFRDFILQKKDKETKLLFNRTQRNLLLKNLLHYYKVHIPSFPNLKTPEILQEIFN